MSFSKFIFPIIAAVAVFILYTVLVQFAAKKDTIRDRIRRMSETLGENTKSEKEELPDTFRTNQEYSALGESCNRILQAFGTDTEGFRKSAQLRFYQAGLDSPDAFVYYLFFKRIGVWIFVLLGIFIGSADAEGMTKVIYIIVAIMIILLGIFGSDAYLKNQRMKREKILQRSFPDALDLLLVCVDSGLALDGALARVCKELGSARPEITQELNRTRLELTLLNDRTQALNNLAERTDMLAFRSLVTTLLQSEKFGTSLTDTLRVLSEDFRHTRLMMAEEKAGRLPVLITLPLITLMMPALFLIILGSAILKVMGIIHGQS